MIIKTYLYKLIKNAHKYQKVNIADISKKVNSHWYGFSFYQWIFIIIAIVIAIFYPKCFNKDLIGYIITMFSIFIGLLLSLLTIMFDKFQNINYKLKVEDTSNTAKILYLEKTKQFYIQYNTLTAYSIFIAILIIFLLMFSYFIDYESITQLNINLSELLSIKHSILFYIVIGLFSLYKIVVIYFVFDFFYLLTYSLVNSYIYMNKVYTDRKIEFEEQE